MEQKTFRPQSSRGQRRNVSWNIQQLVSAVANRYGREQGVFVNGAVQGIVSRQFYASHQFEQALRLHEEVPEEADPSSVFRIVFGDQHTDWRQFELSRKRAEADFVACAESMNAIPDLIGHVIYFALGCNLDYRRLPPRRVSLASVLAGISTNAVCATLISKVHALTDHEDYRYLTDLV